MPIDLDSAQPASLAVIAKPAPEVAVEAALALLRDEYGVEGSLSPLTSERDQNFAVQVDGENRFVLKIANAAEDPRVTDMQIQVLEHLAQCDLRVAVPVVHRTLTGVLSATLAADGHEHRVRLVSFLPGIPLSREAVSKRVAASLGECLARLGAALKTFRHAGEQQLLLWDMQRAAELRVVAEQFCPAHDRPRITAVLDDFEANALPALAAMRKQVIHNDANPANVLVDRANPGEISGFIDFGDMLLAPLIVDVAIAASYLRASEGDPLAYVLPLVAGYASVTPLTDAELALLYDLIRTRLAATSVILGWRKAARGEDDGYLLASRREDTALLFLERLDDLGRSRFLDRVAAATAR